MNDSSTGYLSTLAPKKLRKKRTPKRRAPVNNTVRVVCVPEPWSCACADCLVWTQAQP